MNTKILYVIISLLAIALLLREGCNQSSKDDLISDVAQYETEAQHYKGLNGAEVARNKSLMLENSDQIESILSGKLKNDTLTELLKKYKDLKSVIIAENIIEIRDSIGYDTIRIPCDFKPFPVRRDSSHYMFAGTIHPSYFKIDSLKIFDKQSIVFGKRKMGFLKRSEYNVEVIHSNPLVSTSNIGSYAIKEQRKKVVVSVGVSYGLNLSTGTIQPVIGVNVGFPLIYF